jgi:hypothetical protein
MSIAIVFHLVVETLGSGHETWEKDISELLELLLEVVRGNDIENELNLLSVIFGLDHLFHLSLSCIFKSLFCL